MKYILTVLLFVVFIYTISTHTDIPKNRVIQIKVPLMDTRYEKKMAFDYLNTLRQNAGMPYYFTSKLLGSAAQSHANYLVANHSIGHSEVPGRKDFTGTNPMSRAFKANYKVGMIRENVTKNVFGYKASIYGLFSAIYHRFGFLDFQTDEIGIGVAQDLNDTNQNAYVFDMGIYELNDLCTQKSYGGHAKYVYHVCKDANHRIKKELFFKALRFKKSQIKKIVIYPYDGQKDIPPAFYEETPDPLPDYDVSGFPISIQFNDYYFKRIQLISFELFDPNDKKLKARLLTKQNDPNLRFKENQYALFPLKRLSFNARYKVIARYKLDGKKGESVWSFYTRKISKRFFKISGDKGSVTIKNGSTCIVYFEPQNGHDILKTLHFPSGVNAEFLDQNTIKITLYSNHKSSFKITSAKKILKVKVTD